MFLEILTSILAASNLYANGAVLQKGEELNVPIKRPETKTWKSPLY